jgi:hypothetical protein
MSTDPTSGDLGLSYAFRQLHDDETALAGQLIQLGDQHGSEHEIRHVVRDLLAWSHDNLARVSDTAAKHDVRLSATPGLEAAQEYGQVPGLTLHQQPSAAGLRLLQDLRTTYLLASGCSLSWELLAQYAQARRETDILDLAGSCHPRTLRQMRWANTMLKTQSPQALTSP